MKKKRVLFTTLPVETIPFVRRVGRTKVLLETVEDCLAAGNNPEYLSGIIMPNFGLHFLKANVSSIDIIEYPTWKELEEKLKYGNYEIVGISFYTCGYPHVLKLISMCRKYNIKEVWGGNYGVLTPGIEQYFDRVFIGNAESQIKLLVEGEPLSAIKHPVMYSDAGFSSFKKKVGYLYTARGCGLKCSFCVTPKFAPELMKTPINEIIRVLDVYKEHGVGYIMIQDETFLQDIAHSYMVIRELSKRGFLWYATTRADHIKGHIREFMDQGMISVYMGIESVNSENLKRVGKQQNANTVFSVVEELKNAGCSVTGTYILCFENDTVDSIYKDIQVLNTLELYVCVFMILTPFFGSAIYKEMKRKGMIVETDPTKYDDLNLVWKHPNIKPNEAKDLIEYAVKNTCHPVNYYKKKVLLKWNRIEKGWGHTLTSD